MFVSFKWSLIADRLINQLSAPNYRRYISLQKSAVSRLLMTMTAVSLFKYIFKLCIQKEFCLMLRKSEYICLDFKSMAVRPRRSCTPVDSFLFRVHSCRILFFFYDCQKWNAIRGPWYWLVLGAFGVPLLQVCVWEYLKKAHITKSRCWTQWNGKANVRGKCCTFFTQPCGAEFDCRSCLEKKKSLLVYFIVFAFETSSRRWYDRSADRQLTQRAAFQMVRFWNVLSNEMEKRCLYGAVMMHAAVLSLPYRRDVSFNVLQSRGPIRSHVAPGDWSLHGRRRDGGEGGGGGERLGVHHILPISLQFQTTGPGEMTVGAANCEINWTCDPRGRDQHPASRKRVCNHSYISSWERNSRAPRRRPESAVSFLDKMSPDVAELHLTCVTLQQSVWDVLSRCRLSLEAFLQREVGFVGRSIVSSLWRVL